MAKIIDGKALAMRIRETVKKRVAEAKAMGIVPGLAVVLVGDDPASRVYVNTKKKPAMNLASIQGTHLRQFSYPKRSWRRLHN